MEAEVSYEKKMARVIADENVTDEALEDAVGRTGRFTGTVISREPEDPKPP